MVGNGIGARHGILFKTAVSLEEAGKVQVVALDKTGTITKGAPKVTDVIPAQGVSEDELLRYAYSLEIKSEHPLAKAVVEASEEQGMEALDVDDFTILPGNGLSGKTAGRRSDWRKSYVCRKGLRYPIRSHRNVRQTGAGRQDAALFRERRSAAGNDSGG